MAVTSVLVWPVFVSSSVLVPWLPVVPVPPGGPLGLLGLAVTALLLVGAGVLAGALGLALLGLALWKLLTKPLALLPLGLFLGIAVLVGLVLGGELSLLLPEAVDALLLELESGLLPPPESLPSALP